MAGIQVDVTERRRDVEASIRFSAIVESSEDAIISQDGTGGITSWNPGATRLFGYTPTQMLGGDLDRLVAPGALDSVRNRFQQATRGEAVEPFEEAWREAQNTERSRTE